VKARIELNAVVRCKFAEVWRSLSKLRFSAKCQITRRNSEISYRLSFRQIESNLHVKTGWKTHRSNELVTLYTSSLFIFTQHVQIASKFELPDNTSDPCQITLQRCTTCLICYLAQWRMNCILLSGTMKNELYFVIWHALVNCHDRITLCSKSKRH
jgi:hypothetical protein